MISSWTSSVALMQLIAWADQSPGLPSMAFIQFRMYSVVTRSVGWKPVVADVLNQLLNLIGSALSILSVKVRSFALCTESLLSMSWLARRAAKSEDLCSVSQQPAVNWF
jgi:hypothetical protein